MNPIFIIGMPRSGTKLLREILNQHKDISIPLAETGFIPFFYRRRHKYGCLDDPKNFRKFYNDFKKTSFYYHIDMAHIIWYEPELYNSTQTHSMVNILTAIYRLHAVFEKKKIWGDKTPEYIYHTRLIKRLFPKARFVHIIRDVRDYCLSTRKAWNKNIIRAADKWVKGINIVRKDIALVRDDYYELTYERLIEDPDDEISKLCHWLDIKYTPDIIVLKRQVENLGDAKNKVGILSQNSKKWQSEFCLEEIQEIEAVAGKMLVTLGYDVKFSMGNKTLTKRENLLYAIADIYNLFIFRQNEYGSLSKASVRLFRDFKSKIYQAMLY